MTMSSRILTAQEHTAVKILMERLGLDVLADIADVHEAILQVVDVSYQAGRKSMVKPIPINTGELVERKRRGLYSLVAYISGLSRERTRLEIQEELSEFESAVRDEEARIS